MLSNNHLDSLLLINVENQLLNSKLSTESIIDSVAYDSSQFRRLLLRYI